MRKVACVLFVLGLASMASAAEHWRGAGWGGDGSSWNDPLNWDEAVPSATTWDANRSLEQGTPNNHDIRITANGTCGAGTIYNQAGYTVNLTVLNGVTMTNNAASGTTGLAYNSGGIFTVKTGATYDMRYSQLALESGNLTVIVETDGLLYCSTLRHNNGAMMDVYGDLRAWTVSRISAEGTYRLNVYNGGLFRVDSGVPTSAGWSDGGKVTQFISSTVMLAGNHTGHYTDLVQMGEVGTWEVSYANGYTTIHLAPEPGTLVLVLLGLAATLHRRR